MVLYWGRQESTEPLAGAPSEGKTTELSSHLSEQTKKRGEGGQSTAIEGVSPQQQSPEQQYQVNSRRTRARTGLPGRKRTFSEERREHLERMRGQRSQGGPRWTSLEGPKEKAGISDRGQMDQPGQENPAPVKDLEGADPRTVIDGVMTALDDPDPEVREEALDALEDLDDEAINLALLKALADENGDVREKAMDVIDEIQSASILPSLEQALVSGDDYMREEALSILEDIPDPRAVDLIIEKGLLNYDHSISQAALDSLEFITDQEFDSYEQARAWWDANRDTFNFDL
jgi:hypothetical protein